MAPVSEAEVNKYDIILQASGEVSVADNLAANQSFSYVSICQQILLSPTFFRDVSSETAAHEMTIIEMNHAGEKHL